ncbi:cystathionine gamma-synthase [Streptomyces sp. MnatMP-M27]|uniref:trans-sulfuration enzyme family protein n=1 Tax=Streptomyces sp. MnatMP-M27 TaxID=1839768 RepID=UPI00081EA072|nr:aminotransferase class I/II-fold pyridoxal phosphate-dependent enzyme [Streptomyces sp. MnatMP-M27]SCF93524.1 cystathionine gamma-synthase [Streptomyces sp. MnatMP-M27]
MNTPDRAAIGFESGLEEEANWVNDLRRRRREGPRSTHNHVVDASVGTSTRAVHSGVYQDPVTGAVGTPIFQTSTFLLDELSYAAFSRGATRDVPIYTRYGNPSQWAVQEKAAALEGAQSAVVTSSGMSAIASTVYALTNNGSHIITAYDVYGGTYNLMREDMPSAGREVTFVDPTDLSAIARAIRPETQLMFFETLTNPLLKAPPLREIATLARQHDILLVVDNTLLSPVNLRPLELGADVVLHSATKYLNGHSDLTSGVVAASRKFADRIWAQILRFGGTLEPFACFLLERGMKTLVPRMRAHNENSTALARFLADHPKVRAVYHPSLDGYPYRQLKDDVLEGYGGIVAFEVEGGDDAALKFLDKVRVPCAATSLGGVESLVSMPTNTSHCSLTTAQRAAIGINGGLVRYSAGIEDTEDLIEDTGRALDSL